MHCVYHNSTVVQTYTDQSKRWYTDLQTDTMLPHYQFEAMYYGMNVGGGGGGGGGGERGRRVSAGGRGMGTIQSFTH